MVQPGSFDATQVGFDERTALAEAGRCFRCDAVYAGPTFDVIGRPRAGPPTPIPTPRPATPDIAGGTP